MSFDLCERARNYPIKIEYKPLSNKFDQLVLKKRRQCACIIFKTIISFIFANILCLLPLYFVTCNLKIYTHIKLPFIKTYIYLF